MFTLFFVFAVSEFKLTIDVVVKDLGLKDEDLKIGPRGQGLSSRTTTL